MTNCCNDYGQCTQGKDCPARATNKPYWHDEFDDADSDFIDALGLIAVALTIIAIIIAVYLTYFV